MLSLVKRGQKTSKMVISLHFVPLGLDCTEGIESLATKPVLDYIKSQHLLGAVPFLALLQS